MVVSVIVRNLVQFRWVELRVWPTNWAFHCDDLYSLLFAKFPTDNPANHPYKLHLISQSWFHNYHTNSSKRIHIYQTTNQQQQQRTLHLDTPTDNLRPTPLISYHDSTPCTTFTVTVTVTVTFTVTFTAQRSHDDECNFRSMFVSQTWTVRFLFFLAISK